MNNAKQLTPEVISKELEIFFTQRKPLDMKNPAYPSMLIEEYGAQQTAAKDERIKELEEHARTMYDKLTGKIALDRDRIAELENKYNKSCDDRDNSDGWATEMQRQRDQSFDLLEKWKVQHPYIKPRYRKPNDYQKVQIERDLLLSSRENKKP